MAAAVEVFGRRGFQRASMAEIARAAGVATGSIYNYFRGKDHLITEVFNQYMEKYLAIQRHALANETPGANQLAGLCTRHFEVFAHDRQLARVFHVHWREAQAVVRDELRPSLRSYFELITNVLQQGIYCGDYSRDLDLRLASKIIVGSLDEVVTTWVLSEQEYDLNGQAKMFGNLMTQTFRTKTQSGV